MPTYSLTAINVGGFPLGESDKVVSMFSSERGLVRAVAKGARKPGTKMSGKSEALCVNNLLIATGRSLDIITQAESVATFSRLRTDLVRLTYGLYYAELAQSFGEGLEQESDVFFQLLLESLTLQESAQQDAHFLALEFEMCILRMLGLSPELTVCVGCREPLTERNLSVFIQELGGVMCEQCAAQRRSEAKSYSKRGMVRENGSQYSESVDVGIDDGGYQQRGIHITPMVWKMLVSATSSAEERLSGSGAEGIVDERSRSEAQRRAIQAARRVTQKYIEERAGRKMKSLEFLGSLSA